MQGNPPDQIDLPPEALWGDINGTPVELIEACEDHPDAGVTIVPIENDVPGIDDTVMCQECDEMVDAI